MTYGLVPDYIVEWQRALFAALRVEFIRPGLQEMNAWRDFLFVMEPLKQTEGGEFSKADLAAVVAMMRDQNQKRGGNWSLRASKILQQPETFRDLVQEARAKRRQRPRETPRKESRTVGDVTIAIETDPAVERAAQPVGEEVDRFMREYRERQQRRSTR